VSDGDSKLRLLVIAPAELDGRALRGEVEQRAGGREAEVRLVAPAVTESKVKHVMGDVDEAIGEADERLESSIDGLRSERVAASGQVGDSDPMVAAEDALGAFPADEILIVTHREEEASWFEEDLYDRAAERFEPPVFHIELTGGGGRQGMEETEHSGPGRAGDEPDPGEVELTENLPPFSKRDLLGIVVAIVGTIVLAILAANVADHPNTATAAAKILIAIAFALVNLAHVVGLVFFNAQQYRGFGRNLFGRLSLYGTPAAIVVSALI